MKTSTLICWITAVTVATACWLEHRAARSLSERLESARTARLSKLLPPPPPRSSGQSHATAALAAAANGTSTFLELPGLLASISAMPIASLPAAVESAERRQDSESARPLLVALFSRWASTDPQSALARAARLRDEETNLACQAAIHHTWKVRDPEAFTAWISQIITKTKGLNPHLAGSFKSIVHGLPFDILDSAVKQLPSAPARALAYRWLSNAAVSVIGSNPEVALQLSSKLVMGDLPASGPPVDNLGFALSLARHIPEKTVPWIMENVPAEKQADLLGRAMRTLGDYHPDVAAAYVTSLPDGKSKDDLMAAMAIGIGSRDPQQAIPWIARISDQGAIETAAWQMTHAWRSVDRAAAEAWFAGTPLLKGDQGAKLRERAASVWR